MKYRVSYKVKGFLDKNKKIFHTEWYQDYSMATYHLNDIAGFDGVYDAKIEEEK
jgi:hypothetical protein